MATPRPHRCLRPVRARRQATGKVDDLRRAATPSLATGGAGKVYLYTTNPDTATGDGIAMAWRAGCRGGEHGVHPVPPDLPVPPARQVVPDHARRCAAKAAVLQLPRRRRASCRAHDERAELAPRDIVARAIDFEMKKHGLDCVLPRHHAPAARTSSRSTSRPSTRAAWSSASTSRSEPIPVVPAAHYTCGGVRHRPARAHRPAGPVRDRRDRLHRPARRQPAGQQLAARMPGVRPRRRAATSLAAGSRAPPAAARLGREPRDRRRRGSRDLAQLGRAAPLHVELRRHRAHQQAPGARARTASSCCRTRSRSTTRNFRVTRDLLELRNLVDVAELIVRSALARARKPRPALQPRLSGYAAGGARHGADPGLALTCHTTRRSLSACASVPLSTYSSSPPTGTPRASRLTASPRIRNSSPR